MSSKIRSLSINDISIIQFQELGETVPGGPAAGPRAPHEHVRERGAASGPRAWAPGGGPARASLGRDQVVRGPRVRTVVQFVYWHVDASTARDWLKKKRNYIFSIVILW